MYYEINFQYLPKDATELMDEWTVGVEDVDSGDSTGAVILPNIGDYVQLDFSNRNYKPYKVEG
jgi:hypothetical protein